MPVLPTQGHIPNVQDLQLVVVHLTLLLVLLIILLIQLNQLSYVKNTAELAKMTKIAARHLAVSMPTSLTNHIQYKIVALFITIIKSILIH